MADTDKVVPFKKPAGTKPERVDGAGAIAGGDRNKPGQSPHDERTDSQEKS
jgi:hypothetical protein